MAAKKIGAKIVIDGEQEFRQALLQSKNAMKEFDSEMKLVTAQFKNNEKSMEALKSKQAVYQKQQQELTKQSKLLVEQIQKASTEYNKAAQAQEKQADKIKKLEQALEKAKKEYGDSADEVQELERELSEANAEYDKQQRAIDQLSNKITKWNTDLNKTQTELIETDRALEETNDSIDHFDENMEDAEQETKKFGIVMGESAKHTESLRVSLGSLVSAQVVVDVLRNCAHAIKEVATAAIDVGMKFEASMSNVQALSGATGATLDALGEKAREMGSKTIYSASESADAFSYMALAGWDAKQMLDGIEPVLNLAAAANMDLAQASDIVTDYITAFGLKAEDAAHFSDLMATAMSTSNTTVELLGESYKNCAATCGSLGIAVEDVTAVLATMANAGVKGGEAGTALNSIMTRLATNTKNCNDKLEAYGVHVFDSSGKMNSLSSILNGLANVWGEMSQQEQAALAKSIAGVSHFSKFQTIMLGVSEAAKEGGQSFDDYAAALRDCDGAAEEMAKTMQDNLAGDITILKSALEGLGIATEGVFDDSFREAVQGATDAVSQLERAVSSGDLGVSLQELGDAVADMTNNLMDAAIDALPGFIDKLTWIVNNVDYIGAGITTLVSALAAYKAATIASTIATEGFTVALNVNPYVLAATAIAALVIGLDQYADAADAAIRKENEATQEANRFIESQNQLFDSIDQATQKRKDDIAAMDAQASTAHKLSDELFAETATNERRTAIISQLNSIYPSLNLAMNEQGEIIGTTKAKLDDYIDSSVKLAKVEAAREHLTEIAKEQFDAEMALGEAKDKVAEASKRLLAAQDAEAAEQKTHVDISGEMVEVYNEYDIAVEEAQKSLEGLKDTQSEASQKVEELGEEYQRTLDYISDNGGVVDGASESFDEMGNAIEQVDWITEDLAKEFEDLEKSISNSVASSLDLTQKWSQDWNTSTEDMTKNVQSQIDGIEKWAENFDELANTSKVAIDDRVMKYLADMGTEGAGLVQQLTDELEKSPEKLQEFSDKMAEYLTLQDSVAAEITDSYITVMEESMTGAADAVRENADIVQEAASDAIVEGLENAGKEGTKALADGLGDGAENVSTAANKVGDAALKGITDKTGANGEKLKEVGDKSDKALAEGLSAGKAPKAAQTVSQEILDAVASTLSEDAGNEAGANFMGGIMNAIEEYGEQILEAARAYAEEARNIMNNPDGGGDDNGGDGGGGGELPGHADGLAYVPYDNYLARLHEGERVLTKAENQMYSALMGNVKSPSFDVSESGLGDASANNAVVINNRITVDGAQDPEAWTQSFIRTLKREARMA